MAYEIISQNNNTTTLSDGTNTITVPSRVVLATGTTYEITEVNNSTATLEGSDGSVIRDVPCVAVLAGGGGSSLPDQTGHSGEFLTTDGTDASWTAVDALPSQTGQSGKFLTTDGTDASWSDKPLTNTATGYNSLTVGGNAAYNGRSTNVGINSTASSGSGTAFGNSANCSGPYGIAIGASPAASKDYTIAIGNYAVAQQIGSIQLGKGTNNETSTFCVGLVSDNVGTTVNYKLLDANGTIPTDRFTTTPSTDGTYVPTLTISSGTPTRSWTAPSGGLPSQTGNSGKFLTTDGTDASWSDKPLVNTATGNGSVTILGSASTTYDTVNIGASSEATSGYAIGIGFNARASGTQSVALGNNITATQPQSIAIGNANATGYRAIAIGSGSAGASYAYQIGMGTNNVSNSLSVGTYYNNQVLNYQLLNLIDGTIPTERLTKANTTVTLAVADWSSNTQTVSVTGMTATAVVLVAPDSTSQSDYTSAGILCTAQGAGTLTFTCSTTPTNAITVNVVAL